MEIPVNYAQNTIAVIHKPESCIPRCGHMNYIPLYNYAIAATYKLGLLCF